MGIEMRWTHTLKTKDVGSCVDGWTHVLDTSVGGEFVAAVLCIVLIWTLIRYRRRGAV